MSYILDALNKAEQTRKQGQNEAQATQVAGSNNIQPKQNNLLLIIPIVCALGFLVYWFTSWQTQQETTTPLTTSAPALDTSTIIKSYAIPSQTKTEHEKIAQKTDVMQHVVTIIHPDVLPVDNQKSQTTTLPTLMQLPPQTLENLPTITIAAHIYNAIASKRLVIINDKVLHENKYISENLLLKNITQHGVELEFDGISFSMTAFDAWPY